jgi:hypothetical protein
VSLEEELLKEIDQIALEESDNRSRLIDRACRFYLESRERKRSLDAIYADGYERVPEKPIVANAQVNLVDQVLSGADPVESYFDNREADHHSRT